MEGREGEREGRQDAAVAEKWWSVKERGVACLSERGGKRKTVLARVVVRRRRTRRRVEELERERKGERV